MSNFPTTQSEIEASIIENDQNSELPLEKKTKNCTKYPLYPLSHFLSYKKFLPTYKAFLVCLKPPQYLLFFSGALSNEKWRQDMDVEMEALGKNKT